MIKLLLLPFKLLRGFLKLSGVKGGLLLAIGVAIGILIAPQRGSVMRARLRARLAEARAGGGDAPADADLVL